MDHIDHMLDNEREKNNRHADIVNMYITWLANRLYLKAGTLEAAYNNETLQELFLSTHNLPLSTEL